MSFNRIMCSIVLASSSIIYTMENEKTSRVDLTKLLKETAYGSIGGVCEVTVNSPLVFWKNTLQDGKKIPWSTPKIWWRGYKMNATAMGPTTAIQTGTNAGLETVISGSDMASKVERAFLAGSISAGINSPVELIIIDQQKNNGSVSETIKKLIANGGKKVITRGFVPTAIREGAFTTGYLVMFPAAQEAIKQKVDNAVVAYVGAGSLTGAIVASVTHPVDTIKTRMQIDYQGKQHSTMLDTMRSIYHKNGMSGFFAGVAPRALRASLAIPLIGTICKQLSMLDSKE